MDEFAPLYSRRERIRIALILAAITASLFLVAQFWFIPWVSHYASHANCYFYGEMNGVELLFYAIFVGSPLSLGLTVLILLGPRSLRVIRAGQDPLPGEKVLRRTKYRRGRAALPFPVASIIIILACIAIAVWGSFQVEKLTRNIVPCSNEQKAELGITN
jgi:hypothetical protein